MNRRARHFAYGIDRRPNSGCPSCISSYGSGPTAISKTIHYAYEANGLKKRLTYPDGTEQTSTYDQNRLATITVKKQTIQYQNYQWRMPTQVTMPGSTRTLAYDSLQRPTRILSTANGGAVIMDYRYTYDAVGNISQRSTEDGDYLYTYDALDRLTGATPPGSLQQGAANPSGLPVEQYTYDGVHNRKTSAHQPGPWAYNANNELQGYGAGPDEENYTYDANGNTTEQKTGNPQAPSKARALIYNAAERLSEIKDNGISVAKYQYDPMGRRFKKDVQGTITWFLYADEGLIAEFGGSGSQTKMYGWKPAAMWGKSPIWKADQVANEWQLSLFHADSIGTPQVLTGLSGDVKYSVLSSAFGASPSTIDSEGVVFGFAGQYFDIESKLYNNLFRDYNASNGRYVQSDPVSLSGGVNLYAYVGGRVTGSIDPFGLCPMIGAWKEYPHPTGPLHAQTCPNGSEGCIDYSWKGPSVQVSAEFSLKWKISCESSCECLKTPMEIDGAVDLQFGARIPIPLPMVCKVAGYVPRYGKAAANLCVVWRLSRIADTVRKVILPLFNERLPYYEAAVKALVDPDTWCRTKTPGILNKLPPFNVDIIYL